MPQLLGTTIAFGLKHLHMVVVQTDKRSSPDRVCKLGEAERCVVCLQLQKPVAMAPRHIVQAST